MNNRYYEDSSDVDDRSQEWQRDDWSEESSSNEDWSDNIQNWSSVDWSNESEEYAIVPYSGFRFIKVYVDGSCMYPTSPSPSAGFGLYFPILPVSHQGYIEDVKIYGNIPGEQQTNNRAEISAIIRAMQLCNLPNIRLHIFTDYKNCVNVVEEYYYRKQEGSLADFNLPICDQDLWERLIDEVDSLRYRPKLSFIRSHSGNFGHDLADEYARIGATTEYSFEDSQSFYLETDDENEAKEFLFDDSMYL